MSQAQARPVHGSRIPSNTRSLLGGAFALCTSLLLVNCGDFEQELTAQPGEFANVAQALRVSSPKPAAQVAAPATPARLGRAPQAPEVGLGASQPSAPGAQTAPASAPAGCGYQVSSGTYAVWPGGYQGWVELENVAGEVGTTFEVLVDVGDTTIVDGYEAVYTAVEDGYLVSEPPWMQWVTIPVGRAHRFGFIGSGTFGSITPYTIRINGEACDVEAPRVELTASSSLVTSEGTLTLAAEASDNVAVRKVVIERDGALLAELTAPPYTLELNIDAELNGRHTYTATAYDPSGNSASDSARVLVSIGDRFVGTATGNPEDYEHAAVYFNQITPENGGKWGSVEATRGSYQWDELDAAYGFAQQHDFPFKMHTLVWGQQQPSWLATLSPGEQLEAIETWFQAVSERYPELPLVEVVNEPINAPPSYAEALGGAGETGYDWVIRAFELARQYFPDSELLLNEYNVVILDSFTTEYLTIIELLQERGLIDGIGEQAHYLERAELPVVAANLDRLAATGLPIYISELDVHLADDTRHANVFRDLFTLFWEHPSVLGVTHWGHLQGSVWRQDAYLIRSDGTPRPALEWLVCYLDGGEDCSVPAYVPQPWTGNQYGVTLEAELYDSASGLLALGDTVAYTDAGDWLSFSPVVFQAAWDTFYVTYAKGNEAVGSISLHLDSLDSEPVLSLELPPTAGWGSFETLEVPWPPVEGERAVFVSFNDVDGVANLDRIRFGTPPPASPNLVSNGHFESDASGWYTWGGATLTVSSDLARSGAQSLLVTDRGESGGVAAIALADRVVAGASYTTSFWVTIRGAQTAPVNVTRELDCGEGSSWAWVGNHGAVPEGTWVNLTGSFTIPPDCDPQTLQVYVEGPPAGVELLVDDVVIEGPPPDGSNLIANGDFEVDTSGWYGWGGGVIEPSTDLAYTGAQSLVVRERTAGVAAIDLTAQVSAGQTYASSFWVTITGADAAPVNVARLIRCDGQEDDWDWLGSEGAVPDSSWANLTGTVTIPADCTLVQLQLHVEGPPSGVNLYVDHVTFTAQ